jgi:hypothetical protein
LPQKIASAEKTDIITEITMNRRLFHLLVASASFLALALAQGPKGPGGNPDAPRTGTGPDVTAAITIKGDVTAVQSAAGAQYPTIVVDQKQIKIAPVWFMIENDFEIKVGDQVEVLAAPCACADGSLFALKIAKGTETIELRDSLGLPLWTTKGGNGSQNGPNPSAPRTGEGCVDPASIKTVTGKIDSVTAGVGIQQPTLVLKSGADVLTIKIGPERVLFDSDIELAPGQEVTVRYGLATCSNENVALSITVGGVTVVLRGDDGRAAWNK